MRTEGGEELRKVLHVSVVSNSTIRTFIVNKIRERIEKDPHGELTGNLTIGQTTVIKDSLIRH